MAALSDQLLVFAILAYTLAMLAYAVEHSFGTRSLVNRVASRELVGAGAAVDPPVDPVDPVERMDRAPAPVDPVRAAALAGRGALALTLLGWVLHLACIVTRGLAAHRVPWGNMYEFVLAACLVGATAWLLVLWRRPVLRPLGQGG